MSNFQAETAYGLIRDFLKMVCKHEGEQLNMWIKTVLESGLPELNSFVCGILKDKDAVGSWSTVSGDGACLSALDNLVSFGQWIF